MDEPCNTYDDYFYKTALGLRKPFFTQKQEKNKFNKNKKLSNSSSAFTNISNKMRFRYKLSIGIICIRYNYDKQSFEFLTIKRRTTYAFCDFIKQKYNAYDDNRLTYLFNNMTLDEKITIATKEFSYMWFRAGFHSHQRDSSYFKKSNYFEHCFWKNNKDKRLINLLSNTNSTEIEYEFPKGRKNGMEKDLDTALREFEEETNIKKNDINIIPNFQSKILFKSDGNYYKYKFYLAFPNKQNKVKIDFKNKHQIGEVNDIKWFTIKEFECVNTKEANDRYLPIMKNIIKYAKNKKLIDYF